VLPPILYYPITPATRYSLILRRYNTINAGKHQQRLPRQEQSERFKFMSYLCRTCTSKHIKKATQSNITISLKALEMLQKAIQNNIKEKTSKQVRMSK